MTCYEELKARGLIAQVTNEAVPVWWVTPPAAPTCAP